MVIEINLACDEWWDRSWVVLTFFRAVTHESNIRTNLHRYYAKRCFLGLIECLAKHMMVFKDETYHEIMVQSEQKDMDLTRDILLSSPRQAFLI